MEQTDRAEADRLGEKQAVRKWLHDQAPEEFPHVWIAAVDATLNALTVVCIDCYHPHAQHGVGGCAEAGCRCTERHPRAFPDPEVGAIFAARIARLGCQKPPEGWHCTRQAGHDGPCAALEDGA